MQPPEVNWLRLLILIKLNYNNALFVLNELSMALSVNKKSKFFISINKQDGHSFVMLGVYDKNKVKHLLCRVGKVADISEKDQPGCTSFMSFILGALFSNVKAKLSDEGVSRKAKGSKHITYQAYDITYSQYLEFVQLLESLQTEENKYECYKPIAENNDEVTLELTNKILLSSTPKTNIKNNVGELRVGNTCRHTAIGLVEQTKHSPVSSMVSDNFFVNLPYKTVLEYGKPSDNIPFYVLPFPPSAFPELEHTKLEVITKLYSRMEQMLLLNTHSKSTQDKFSKLKELYLQIIGPQKDISLIELLQSIQTWKSENNVTLGALRQTYFWDLFFKRKSATLSLIEGVVHDLQEKVKPI